MMQWGVHCQIWVSVVNRK